MGRARRAGKHVVVRRGDRVERGASTSDVARDRDPGAAAEVSDERRALVEQRPRALDLEFEELPEPRARRQGS